MGQLRAGGLDLGPHGLARVADFECVKRKRCRRQATWLERSRHSNETCTTDPLQMIDEMTMMIIIEGRAVGSAR